MLAARLRQLCGQLLHQMLDLAVRRGALFQLLRQLAQLFLCRFDTAAIDGFLANVEVLQFLFEDRADELGTHGGDAFSGEIPFLWIL